MEMSLLPCVHRLAFIGIFLCAIVSSEDQTGTPSTNVLCISDCEKCPVICSPPSSPQESPRLPPSPPPLDFSPPPVDTSPPDSHSSHSPPPSSPPPPPPPSPPPPPPPPRFNYVGSAPQPPAYTSNPHVPSGTFAYPYPYYYYYTSKAPSLFSPSFPLLVVISSCALLLGAITATHGSGSGGDGGAATEELVKL